MAAPIVFISYCHEGSEHDGWVLTLATKLRENGVDAKFDQWDLRAGHDVAVFMESQIRDSDFVILVCTPTYAKKSNIPTGGVGFEKNIISAELLQSRDLRPKFIPILRSGDFATSLPTYLGSKFAIDLRAPELDERALDQLLRAIHEVEPPSKPPLGQNPYASGNAPHAAPSPSANTGHHVAVSGHVESWEQRALGRFNFLREQRLKHIDPFTKGFWQASFALLGNLRPVTLTDFLQVLRESETGRTGWDIGWVPTKSEIAPYPFQDGIEVWLAGEGHRDGAHSDFWRAEPIGTFSVFRGYTEDEEEFTQRYPHLQFDISLMLWRVAEVLLYLENFSKNLAIKPVAANVSFRWEGLENRRLGHHKSRRSLIREHVCHQSAIQSSLHIPDTSQMKKTLIGNVQKITRPLFEAFDFFTVNDNEAASMLVGLFDPKKEGQ